MNTKQLRILRITEYKGFHILVQQVIKLHIFQFIIFGQGNFYQGFNIITPSKGPSKKLDEQDVIKAGVVTLDMAFATVEALLSKDNPDALVEQNQQAADVVTILEEDAKKEKGEKLLN